MNKIYRCVFRTDRFTAFDMFTGGLLMSEFKDGNWFALLLVIAGWYFVNYFFEAAFGDNTKNDDL